MNVVGFTGASGAGKTTLLEGVLRELKAAGLRVSAVKHARHGFDLDTTGKDSARFAAAGAFEVVVASGQRLAKVRTFESDVQLNVHQLLAELVDCDWALFEGFKDSDVLKFEIWRRVLGVPAAYPEDPFVIGIVTDEPELLPVKTLRPVFKLSEPAVVAQYLLQNHDRFAYDIRHG
jgi:molybdopterin-guanine dinucleotide biosynthesis adapter protein